MTFDLFWMNLYEFYFIKFKDLFKEIHIFIYACMLRYWIEMKMMKLYVRVIMWKFEFDLEVLYNKLIDLFHLAFQVRFFVCWWLDLDERRASPGSDHPHSPHSVWYCMCAPVSSSPEALNPSPIPYPPGSPNPVKTLWNWELNFPQKWFKGPPFFIFYILLMVVLVLHCWTNFNTFELTCNLQIPASVFFIHWSSHYTLSYKQNLVFLSLHHSIIIHCVIGYNRHMSNKLEDWWIESFTWHFGHPVIKS